MIDRDQFYFRLGTKLRVERERLGLTQAGLASVIGISRTSLTNIECGKQRLLVDQLAVICRELRVSPADIMPVEVAGPPMRQQKLADLPIVANFVQSVTSGAK